MKLSHHILFWVFVLSGLVLVFYPFSSSLVESFYFVVMLLPVVAGTTYVFNYYLVPRFLLQRRFGKFFLYLLYLFVVSIYLEALVIIGSFILLAEYQYEVLGAVRFNVFLLAFLLYFVVLIYAFIVLLKQYFKKEGEAQSLFKDKEKMKKAGFTVRSNRQMKTIFYDEVQYLESLSDYVKIHVKDQPPVITKEKISRLSEELPDQFLRIHRSFIINKNNVQSFSREQVEIGGESLNISRSYKDEAWQSLNASNSLAR